MVGIEIGHRHVGGGHDLGSGGGEAQAGELFQIHVGGAGGVVGKEQDALSRRAEVLDEADGEVEDDLAEVDGAVHVEDVQLFVLENLDGGILMVHGHCPRKCGFLSVFC